MTLPQYIDEVKLRMIRLAVVMDLNDHEIAMYINQARQDVQRVTLNSHTERYGKIADLDAKVVDNRYSIVRPYGQQSGIVYAYELPQDLIDIYVVLYKESCELGAEARYYDMRELYGIGMHTWNMPTPIRPIYTVIDNYPTYAPNSALLFSAGKAVPDGAIVTIWYTAAIQGLDIYDTGFNYGADNDGTSPTELNELTILYAIRTLMQRVEAPAAAQSIINQIQVLEAAVVSGYQVEKLKATSLLPSQGAI